MIRRPFARLAWPTFGVGLTAALTVFLAQQPVGATFTASTGDTGNTVTAAQSSIQITSPSPARGVAGTTVTVSGSNLPPTSALSASFGGSPVTLSGTTSTNASGSFTGSTFTVPAAGAGTYDVVFTAGAWSTPPVSFVIPTYYATVTATAGLVSYWRLGTGTTTTAVPDSWGTNNGTASGGFTPGAAGAVAGDTAATLDGTSGRVSIGDPTSLQLGSGSVEAWFKAPGTDTNYHELVSKAGVFALGLYNHQLGFWDDSAAQAWHGTGIAVDDSQWHDVVMTYQSGVANGTKIYLDGALVLTNTLTVASQADPLMLGVWRDPSGALSEYFKGTLDEVAVYNTVLSSSTVLDHYRAR